MKVLCTNQDYNGTVRVEKRTEHYALHEDFLLLAKRAQDAAQAAFLFERAPEKDKEAARGKLEAFAKEVRVQLDILYGYDCLRETLETEKKTGTEENA